MLSLKRFLVYYALYVAFLASCALVFNFLFPTQNWLANQFWVIFGFVAGVTLSAYILVHFGVKFNPETGILAVMISIAFKMLFCLTFIVAYSFKVKEIGLAFVFNFFSLYLLFTAFEIYALLRNLRHQNK